MRVFRKRVLQSSKLPKTPFYGPKTVWQNSTLVVGYWTASITVAGVVVALEVPVTVTV
jgi:hypothetical protein